MSNIIDKYWEIIGRDLTLLMSEINNSPITTRNHYGRYISILTDLKEQVGLGIAKDLLIRAGGNKAGIEDASRIF